MGTGENAVMTQIGRSTAGPAPRRLGSLLGLLLALLSWALCPAQAAVLDADGNGNVAAPTDGRLILRHLFGFSGTALTDGALGADASRDAAAIRTYLNGLGNALDVDGDGRRDALTDGLLIWRHLLGRTGTALTAGAIGPGATRTTAAAITAYLAPLVEPPPLNQALLGPLAGATIHAYRLSDLQTPMEGPLQANASTTDLTLAGTLSLDLAGLPADEWVLVTATGGQDLDADDDGVPDAAAIPNLGTLHALARAGDWRTGGVRITALSELIWRYTKNLAGQVHPDDLAIRLGDLIAQFIRTDLDGNGRVDLSDLLHFSPASAAHRAALNFDYQRLFTPDAQDHSLIGALHAGDETLIDQILDQEFGHTLSRYPAPDSRYRHVRVSLALGGEGRAATPDGSLLVDSALGDADQVPTAFFLKDAAQTLVLTATPTAQSQLLGWTGCDSLSADRTQCTISLAASRDLLVQLGPLDGAPPAVTLIDLSGATNTLYPDVVDVVLNATDTDLIARLAGIRANDYIVGSTGDGFLRRVVAVERISDTHYRLETVEASLAEVVGVGSGGVNRALTNADLRGYQAPTLRAAASVATDAFTGLAGIRLVPSADPRDPVLRLAFGTAPTAVTAAAATTAGAGLDAEVRLFEDGDGRITASGTLDISIDWDIDATYCGLLCVQSVRLITKPTTTENLALAVTGTIREANREVLIGSIPFNKILFKVSGVPVWITPKVDLYIGIEGTIAAEWSPAVAFTQAVEMGAVYDRVRGWDGIGNGDFDADPAWQDSALAGELRSYLRTSPSFKLYDAAGPAFPQETYTRFRAADDRQWASDPCDGSLQVAALWGISSRFTWALSGIRKLGDLLHLDPLDDGAEIALKTSEWPLKTWYPQVPCSHSPVLYVDGRGIVGSVAAGADTNLTQSVQLTNQGGVELPWHIDFIDDDATEVNPRRGNLAPGASVDVAVTVRTAGLNPGIYTNPLTFTNDYDPDQPDSRTGTSQKPIRIEVLPVLSTAPVLTAATYTGPGRVQVTWTLGAGAVDGFRIDGSRDGITWAPVLSVAGAAPRSAQVDGLAQGLWYLRVAAYAGAANTPVSNVRTVTVTQDAPPAVGGRLNDTGITTCSDGSRNGLPCPVDGYPWQDAQDGRDATHNNDSDGHAGFSYTKLDGNGNPLPAGATAWSCVRDNVTGLVWEVKTTSGLRSQSNTYSWYNSDANTNGGFAGCQDDGSCTGGACDTQSFVAAVNAQGLCGHRDWRLPSRVELMSIVSNDRYSPAIDTAWFPNTPGGWFWSSSPAAYSPDNAWGVNFYDGYVHYYYKYSAGYVRLVRGGQ